MVYYSYDKDLFFDESGTKIANTNKICAYYSIDGINYHSFSFTKRQNKCQIVYDMIHQYERKGKINYSKSLDCNFLFNVYKAKIHNNFSIRASYMPVSNYNIGAYINLLTDQEEIIETVITNKKYIESSDFIEYFRLKLGIEYLCLGIEKSYGYIIHCSTTNAIRTSRIDNVYNHQRSLRAIDNYLRNENTKRKADINNIDFIKYKALKCLEKGNKQLIISS